MRRNPLTLVIGLLLIFIFGLLLFTFQVRTTEVAVVTTFGFSFCGVALPCGRAVYLPNCTLT